MGSVWANFWSNGWGISRRSWIWTTFPLELRIFLTFGTHFNISFIENSAGYVAKWAPGELIFGAIGAEFDGEAFLFETYFWLGRFGTFVFVLWVFSFLEFFGVWKFEAEKLEFGVRVFLEFFWSLKIRGRKGRVFLELRVRVFLEFF